jgi:glycosyltransferase involved in cell wall biosynthesis
LYAGWVEEFKGVFDLIRAFSLLKKSHAAIRLVIAGKGRLDDCRSLACDLGVSGSVEFPGWLDDSGMQMAYAQANIFCLPSHGECMPMALLEAMGQGLACVATDVGSVREMLREGDLGVLCPPKSVAQLAEALGKLVADEDLRTMYGDRARAVVAREYSSDEFCRRVSELLKELAKV